jgi:predicted nucleotidyltransferase
MLKVLRAAGSRVVFGPTDKGLHTLSKLWQGDRMQRQDVINLLEAQRTEIRALGVKSLALFGSVSRDEARPDSDVDLLVDFEGRPSFDAFMDLKFYLEDLLKRKVDLVTEGALKPRMKPILDREAIRVA